MKNYNQQLAIITGGASGLGFATAKRFVKSGVNVAIFDLNEEFGKKMAKQFASTGRYEWLQDSEKKKS